MTGTVPLEVISGIHGDQDRLAALNDLIGDVFGISFAEWDKAGYWDTDFVPNTAFDKDGTMAIANVSVYSLDMIIAGQPCRVAQICSCATCEDHRNSGIGSKLLCDTLARVQATHDLVFVMSSDRAISFYRRQGFVPLLEQIPTLLANRTKPKPGCVRLDADSKDDLALIFDLAKRRSPVSQSCGVLTPGLLMFHVINVLPGCLYHIPDLSCVVLMKRRGRRLRIFDIVAQKMPTFTELHPYLTEGRRDLVEFSFLPDQLGSHGLRWRRSRANNLHVLPTSRIGFNMPRVLIPFTAQA